MPLAQTCQQLLNLCSRVLCLQQVLTVYDAAKMCNHSQRATAGEMQCQVRPIAMYAAVWSLTVPEFVGLAALSVRYYEYARKSWPCARQEGICAEGRYSSIRS